MFLGIGQVLPFITGQIPQIGAMLSPMHLPILLCGYSCGPLTGALVGFVCPLLRSVLFGMPKMFPTAIAIAFELCTYGTVAGVLYNRLKNKNIINIYNADHNHDCRKNRMGTGPADPAWNYRKSVYNEDVSGRSIDKCRTGNNTTIGYSAISCHDIEQKK